MKKYIRATTYSRETVIDRLRSISGIHIVSANDEYVVFRDADNKEY